MIVCTRNSRTDGLLWEYARITVEPSGLVGVEMGSCRSYRNHNFGNAGPSERLRLRGSSFLVDSAQPEFSTILCSERPVTLAFGSSHATPFGDSSFHGSVLGTALMYVG